MSLTTPASTSSDNLHWPSLDYQPTSHSPTSLRRAGARCIYANSRVPSGAIKGRALRAKVHRDSWWWLYPLLVGGICRVGKLAVTFQLLLSQPSLARYSVALWALENSLSLATIELMNFDRCLFCKALVLEPRFLSRLFGCIQRVIYNLEIKSSYASSGGKSWHARRGTSTR